MKRCLYMLCLVLISSALLITGCAPAKVELPVINSFDASPPSISAGEYSTLNWDTSGATSASIDQGIGSVALTGTRAIAPSATSTYTLTATNAAGRVVATTQVMVSGTESPPPGPVDLPFINSFTANPPGITTGGSATLSWNVSNATSVAISPGVGTFASSGTTLVSPAATTIYTLTATNEAGNATAMAQVTVSEAYTPPPPPEFAVTSVTASVDPATFTGTCPKNFIFSAVITANGAGTVTYRWERSDGGFSPTQTINFATAGSQTVTTGWTRDVSGTYWVRVRTFTPNEMVSNQASFNLNCSVPFAVTKVVVSVNPTYFSGACPKTFGCSVLITVNGPGTVTYQWERSDGGISPPQTMTFAAAGTASGYTGWPREESGIYGVQVRTIMPNEVVSNLHMFQLNCE